MKKIKRYYLLGFMLVVLGITTACGKEETSLKQGQESQEKYQAQTPLEVGEETSEAVEESSADSKERLDVGTMATEEDHTEATVVTEYEISPEEAKAIVEKGIQAIRDLDAEAAVEYTNVGLFYYIGRGEVVTEQELAEALKVMMSETDFEGGYNNLGVVGWYGLLQDVEFYDSQPFEESKLQELNDYISKEDGMFWNETRDISYDIEKAYQIKMRYDGMKLEDGSEGNEPYVLVVCVDGEWKLDVCLKVMQETERSMEQMVEDASGAE